LSLLRTDSSSSGIEQQSTRFMHALWLGVCSLGKSGPISKPHGGGNRWSIRIVLACDLVAHPGNRAVVFLFSIIFPLTKIVLLLELSLLELLHRKHKAFTLRLMEHLGKWSMMDVMLLAFLVMLVKLGDMVEFHFGPAIIAFVLCVAMSMIASITFDPHAIWEEEVDE
jgi:uncharacterized paraquat-inducible protein A